MCFNRVNSIQEHYKSRAVRKNNGRVPNLQFGVADEDIACARSYRKKWQHSERRKQYLVHVPFCSDEKTPFSSATLRNDCKAGDCAVCVCPIDLCVVLVAFLVV